ncbi:MAG: YesL family protein [Ruminococcus sp.]|jgi:uncharacterized membrane protein YesL|nr:YesL family protein [Ruminococcus sp.]
MEKAKLGITRFFTGLFKNFHRLLLTNLLFAVPLALFGAIAYFVNNALHANYTYIVLAPIIFVYPFYAGVTLVTRNIAKEDYDDSVVKLYFKGIKENIGKFFVHGILFYLAIFLCYSSIGLYFNMAQKNGLFYFPFGIAVIIAIAMLFISYNLPVMTVTFDLSLKDIYKNSALMAFGEIKNNFFVTVGLFFLFLVEATIFILAPSALIKTIILILFSLLIVPSVASYIMNFYVFKDMEQVISNGEIKSEEIKRKIAEKEKGEKEAEEAERYDFSSLDLDERKDGEEYLFFNGKMIKRRVLIEMKKKQEENDEQKEKAEA